MRLRQILVLSLALLSLAVALVTGRDLFYSLFYLWVALIVIAAGWAWLSLRGVRVGRQTRGLVAQAGQIFTERLQLRNASRFPKLWIEVRDDSDVPGHRAGQVLTGLGPHAQRSWTVRTAARQRGRYRLGPLTLVSGDPFGLFQVQRLLPQTNHIVILPYTAPVSGFFLPPGMTPGGEFLRRRTHYVTANAAGVRDYVHGDSLSRIHWKSTARRDRLMVKEFELDPLADLWLLIDGDASVQAGNSEVAIEEPGDHWYDRAAPFTLPPSTEEYMISSAASLAQFFIRQDRSVGLVAYGAARTVVQPDRGERQLAKVLETLAVFRAVGSTHLADALSLETDLLPRGATLVICTATWDTRWVALARGLKRRGVSVAAVIADALTFGGPRSSAGTSESLLAVGIPTVIVRRGDDLTQVLSRTPDR